MFSVGASPYNGEIEQLMGGRIGRRRRRTTSWASAVKRGRVRRDAKGRFLPRGAGIIGGRARGSRGGKKRRYKAPTISYNVPSTKSIFAPPLSSLGSMDSLDLSGLDDPLRLVRPSSAGYGGMSQSLVDSTAMKLGALKRKWNYLKDYTDSDDDVLPQMYPIARDIVRSLNFLKRASSKLDYIPTVPIPRFSAADKKMINKLMKVNRTMKHAGGPEFDRLVARELAKGGNPAASRYDIRQNLRSAMSKARGRLAEIDDPYSYDADVNWDGPWDPDLEWYGAGEDEVPPPPPYPAPEAPPVGEA